MVKWRAVVNKVMNRRVPYNKEVLAAQERFCSMALVGCTGLNVKLGSMTAVLIQRTEAALMLLPALTARQQNNLFWEFLFRRK
jgi:hypothetical protein